MLLNRCCWACIARACTRRVSAHAAAAARSCGLPYGIVFLQPDLQEIKSTRKKGIEKCAVRGITGVVLCMGTEQQPGLALHACKVKSVMGQWAIEDPLRE